MRSAPRCDAAGGSVRSAPVRAACHHSRLSASPGRAVSCRKVQDCELQRGVRCAVAGLQLDGRRASSVSNCTVSADAQRGGDAGPPPRGKQLRQADQSGRSWDRAGRLSTHSAHGLEGTRSSSRTARPTTGGGSCWQAPGVRTCPIRAAGIQVKTSPLTRRDGTAAESNIQRPPTQSWERSVSKNSPLTAPGPFWVADRLSGSWGPKRPGGPDL